MTAADVLEIVTAIEQVGINVWLDGGWAIDALVGKQTRQHEDLDVVVALNKVETIKQVLEQKGFRATEDELPTRLAMKDTKGRNVDFHTVTFDGKDSGIQELQDGRSYRYPPEGFIGRGEIGGQGVKCLTVEVQAACHYGYQPDDKDRHDMQVLNQCFGIELKEPYV